jgi:hypothetical protein
MRSLVTGLSVGIALAACGYEKPPDVPDDANKMVDSGSGGGGSDATLACAPSTTTCTNGTYVDCSATGTPTVTMACPLGCDASQPKCRDVDPSNGVAQYLDMAHTDAAAPMLTLGAGSTISTDTGIVYDGATSVVVPNIDIGDYHVFWVKSLSITGSTVVSGADGLIIVSDGDVSITDLLDVSGNLRVNGPGGGPGTCVGGTATTAGSFSGGGGGGGNGDPGGTGGNADGNASPGGQPGAALADLDLEPLHGGCMGGDATEGTSTCRGVGGGGGGALQIVSRTQIALTSNGVIDASGGGGVAARAGTDTCTSTNLRGGGGGGAGGSVLLEAPQVRLEGSAVIVSTKGGGGSAGGIGSFLNGADGGTSGTAAAGGINQTSGANGGLGGTEAVPPGDGTAGDPSEDGGGAGGAVGRVRFNTSSGTVNPIGGATIRSKQSSSVLRIRLVP